MIGRLLSIYIYLRNTFFKDKDFFDPCPLNADFNGLIIDWKERNYVNPPYDRKGKEAFIIKAYREFRDYKRFTVMLIPANTETNIFHKVIVPNAKVILIKNRVKFKGFNSFNEYVTNKTGQTGSMFVIFGLKPEIMVLDLNK
jgi:hypothetical protein